MAKALKVYLPTANAEVADMFDKRGYIIVGTLKKSDIVVFTGGADVDPSMYGQHKHDRTGITALSMERDSEEAEIFEEAVALNKHCIGICRGAQLLNVLNGGQLWQHVDNHAVGRHGHKLYDVLTEKFIRVSSTHHQMMIPHKSGDIIATANEADSLSMCNQQESAKQTISVKPQEGWTDVEVVDYRATNSLCFQPHPEYGPPECEDYFFTLLDLFVS